MLAIKAIATGVWRHPKVYVVRALEESVWSVEGVPVAVSPGLVVGFSDEAAAIYMLQTERGCDVAVSVGDAVALLQPDLAKFFIDSGLAAMLTADDIAGFAAAGDDGTDGDVAHLEGDYGPDGDEGPDGVVTDDPAGTAPRRGRKPGRKAAAAAAGRGRGRRAA